MIKFSENVPKPEIIAVTDLGTGNKGSISAARIANEDRDRLIARVADPTYRKPSSGVFRCVDGRLPENGIVRDDEGYGDAQGPGGEAIFQPMIDFMVTENPSFGLREAVVSNVVFARSHDRKVIVHGDTHKGVEGCGANQVKRDVLVQNLENADVIVPKIAEFTQLLEISNMVNEADIRSIIQTGAANAKNDRLWDITPAELIQLAIEHGATYETLIDDHLEAIIIADLSEYSFDEEAFMSDNVDTNGDPIEAFVASFGAYKQQAFADAAQRGYSDYIAARRVVGFIAFSIGVPKALTAEERGNGEALPVVVIK